MYMFSLLAEIINVHVANVYEHVLEPLGHNKTSIADLYYYCTNTNGFVTYYFL